jgi:hypothetical protein
MSAIPGLVVTDVADGEPAFPALPIPRPAVLHASLTNLPSEAAHDAVRPGPTQRNATQRNDSALRGRHPSSTRYLPSTSQPESNTATRGPP